MPDLDGVFAVRRELRPILRHQRVGIDAAAIYQHQYRECGDGFGARPHIGDRVAMPRGGAVGVCPAAPDVDDRRAVDGDGDRSAEILPGVEVAPQRFAQVIESWIAVTRDLGHRLAPFLTDDVNQAIVN
ncbi:hypothetical protein [Nocardia cyriacigeorgica]|uniref:hypothetical protein n=1 Tax=Nocardia cyriacigeorgica TaxID=135487 RepID=UPI0024550BCE|nr:hypothetical protein [Nocardia cyriacigeorgica]